MRVEPALLAGNGTGETSLLSGMRAATNATKTTDARPAASHAARQPEEMTTTTAEMAMPVPTPAKCTAVSPGRPAALSRSSTRAEENTSPKALATPPAKRRPRNTGLEDVTAIG